MSRAIDTDSFGLCPICSDDPDILNVGRIHFAVCHEHKVYWPVGSNLFSGWRDEEPETWEANKKLLETYSKRTEAASDASFMENFGRPVLGTLGDCLQETATFQPQGYTRIIGHTGSFWRDIPADNPDEPSIVMQAVTAALDPAPVTIHILAGIPAATARAILKQAAKWLKEHGTDLPGLTPRQPRPSNTSNVPF
jgi:hypothetical protein